MKAVAPKCLDEWGSKSAHYRLVEQVTAKGRRFTLEQHAQDDAMGSPIWCRLVAVECGTDSGVADGDDPVAWVLIHRLAEVLRILARGAASASSVAGLELISEGPDR